MSQLDEIMLKSNKQPNLMSKNLQTPSEEPKVSETEITNPKVVSKTSYFPLQINNIYVEIKAVYCAALPCWILTFDRTVIRTFRVTFEDQT